MSILLWLLLLLFRFGSSGEAPEVTPGPAEPSATAAPSPAPAPSASDEAFPPGLGPLRTQQEIEQRFLTRTPIAACDVVQTDAAGPRDPDDYDCLQQAADAGEGAELLLAVSRDSGTAFVYYRVNPGGPMEVFVDQRATDEGDWIYRRCPVPDDISSSVCE